MDDDKIIKVLLTINEMYGDAIFADKRKLDNILKDLLIGEIKYEFYKGKISALMHALDEQAFKQLKQHKNNPKKTQKYYIDLLKNTYNDEVATFVVRALSITCGIQNNYLNNNKIKIANTSINPTSIENPSQNTEINNDAEDKILTRDEAKKLTGIHITIPYGYTKIEQNAFSSRKNIESITIPSSVTHIDTAAFYLCSVKTIIIPDNVTRINNHAFYLCSKVLTISVSGKNQHYSSENGVLFNKNKTVLICYPVDRKSNVYVIPNSVTYIDERAFYFCNKLTEIVISDNVTNISKETFSLCENLLSINVTEKNPYYSSQNGILFNKNRTKLICYPQGIKNTIYTIPNGVIHIDEKAFFRCENLTNIIIPNNVTTIDKDAFRGCKGLTNIIIPKSVTFIGESAFALCEKITNITLPDSTTSINAYTFFCCQKLTSINIPDSIIHIDEYAFKNTPVLIVSCSKNSFAYNYCLKNRIRVNISNTTNTKITLSTTVRPSEEKDANMQYMWGCRYFNGSNIVKQNYVQAVDWFTKAAKQGHTNAQFMLGACYNKGLGIEKDSVKAVKLYMKAAEQGHVGAQNNLGMCYHEGTGVKRDYIQAMKWFTKAAEQGDANAQYNIASCYYKGLGWGWKKIVRRDYVRAVDWLTKAAKQGHTNAQYSLGYIYYTGKGVVLDYVQAVDWFTKAAKQGHTDAQMYLGACYAEGIGVNQNYMQAIFWFRKADQQGHPNAQNCILQVLQGNFSRW